MKQATKELRELLESYKGDINHHLRRFYRCHIDGSYHGENHYKQNVARIKDALARSEGKKHQRLRQIATSNFICFLQDDFKLSQSTIIREVKHRFNSKLEDFTKLLIDDLLDLVEE